MTLLVVTQSGITVCVCHCTGRGTSTSGGTCSTHFSTCRPATRSPTSHPWDRSLSRTLSPSCFASTTTCVHATIRLCNQMWRNNGWGQRLLDVFRGKMCFIIIYQRFFFTRLKSETAEMIWKHYHFVFRRKTVFMCSN